MINEFVQSKTYKLLMDTQTNLYCADCYAVIEMYKCEMNNDEEGFNAIELW